MGIETSFLALSLEMSHQSMSTSERKEQVDRKMWGNAGTREMGSNNEVPGRERAQLD